MCNVFKEEQNFGCRAFIVNILALSTVSVCFFVFPVQWLSAGVSRATGKEQTELGKTEISLINFSVSYKATSIHVYINS